jgi:hypothetical protein
LVDLGAGREEGTFDTERVSLDVVQDEVDTMLIPAVVHAVFGLVVELDEVAFGEVETLEVRVGGADTEGDMGRVGDDGEVDPMGVMHPVARVVMRRDGNPWRHGGEEATDDFVGGHTEGFEDGEEEGAPFRVVQPGHLKTAS